MNYLKEVLAFHDWLETNQCDATEQALWHHLMAINNKCGWSVWFTVANMTLQAKLGGIDRKTLDRKRNDLCLKGRIEYVSQGKKQAGKYRIISFESGITGIIPLKTGLSVPSDGLNPPALNKLNKTKQNINNGGGINQDQLTKFEDPLPPPAQPSDESTRLVKIFEKEFGRPPSSIETQEILILGDSYGPELVIEALRRSVTAGKLTLRYIQGILSSWSGQNLKTIREIQEHEAGRKSNKTHDPPADPRPGGGSKEDKYRDLYAI